MMKNEELKANVLKAKKLGTENMRIAKSVLTPKFSSREQVDVLLKKEGFEKEYIKSDCENDFTRNMKSGFYYSKDGVCAYEMSGTILIAIFWNEIKGKLINDNSEITYKNTNDITDMSRENDGR
jgi:hypothetical protein